MLGGLTESIHWLKIKGSSFHIPLTILLDIILFIINLPIPPFYSIFRVICKLESPLGFVIKLLIN